MVAEFFFNSRGVINLKKIWNQTGLNIENAMPIASTFYTETHFFTPVPHSHGHSSGRTASFIL